MKKPTTATSGMTLIAKNVRPDAKKRLTLGKALEGLSDVSGFDVYRDDRGRIVLEPQVTVPVAEAWLYRNAQALASVRRGLAQAAAGQAKRIGSFAAYVDDDAES